MSLEGKALLVTGGGGGIGSATARFAAEQGAKVIVADLNLGRAEAARAGLKEPELHLALAVDVSDRASVEALFAAVEAAWGSPPTLLAHAAGVIRDPFRGLAGVTDEDFDLTMAVNVKGTYLVNRVFVERLRARKLGGGIVNVSSHSAMGLWPFPAYSASKAAVNGWSKALAKEVVPTAFVLAREKTGTAFQLGAEGIRVNVVAPGPIDTDFGLQALASVPNKEEVLRKQQNAAPVPLGRSGLPEEVGRVILFLLSPAASYTTGAVVKVDGGCDDQPGLPGNRDSNPPLSN